MTYEDALEENPTVSRAAADRLCAIHSAQVAEMVADLGDRDEYQARDLLSWLGY